MMKVAKVILVIVGVILTSFYLFPFEFIVLPGINTKMAMAAIGLVIFVCEMANGRSGAIDFRYLFLGILAALVSLFSYFAMTFNNTQDNAYLGYLMTLLVWLGGAYCATRWIKFTHGKVSVELVCNYLIAVCVVQCILALLIDNMPSLKLWVNSNIGNFGGMGPAAGVDEYDRLYGIGAALDIAGSRFAAVLILVVSMLKNYRNQKYIWLYILSFFIIGTIGNMIARTTTVGVLMAVLFFLHSTKCGTQMALANKSSFYVKFLLVLMVTVFVVVYFYNTNSQFKANFRFGFEGFFSLFETGEWQSQSNDILMSMYRFPEKLKTWLIGDGYMHNPMGDPYYNGYHWKGFYMGTDVGYLRFLYYFGIFGLCAIIFFIAYASQICLRRNPRYKLMFIYVLLVNYIVWFKVSTDLLVFFAIFLCVDAEANDDSNPDLTYENPISDSLDM